jgi:hypothetical protein
MSRGRKLTAAQRGALERLRQSSLVERFAVRRDWIAVYFETGILERWTFDRPTHLPKYRQLPSDEREWVRQEIPILNEDPDGFDAIFNDETEEVENFLVRQDDIRAGGFFDQRLLVHQIIYRLLSEGWYTPSFKDGALRADWARLHDLRSNNVISRSLISMRGGPTRRRGSGYAVWAHFFDLGVYERGKHVFRSCYDNPKIMLHAIDKLITHRIKITRSTLLYAILHSCYPVTGRGLFGFRPHTYRDIFEKVMMVKKPVVLDMTPDLGSKAMATALCGGVYMFPKENKVMARHKAFAKFSGCTLLPDEGRAADLGIIGGVECLATAETALKDLEYVRKRAAITMVFCREPEDQIVLAKAPTSQRIHVVYGGKKGTRAKLLLYPQR